jgi:hypothetical protein
MPEESSVYVGFTDGASHHTWNRASATWVIYSPTNQLVFTRGVCLRATTNNVVEYSVMIELLRATLSYGIQRPSSLFGLSVGHVTVEWSISYLQSDLVTSLP